MSEEFKRVPLSAEAAARLREAAEWWRREQAKKLRRIQCEAVEDNLLPLPRPPDADSK